MAKTVSMDRVKGLINYFIDNNNRLEDAGQIKSTVAISIEGEAGIGKTSIVEQIAKERNMGLAKINVAQLEEVGDLLGMPLIENECQIARKVKAEDGSVKIQIMPNTVWLTNKQIESMDKSLVRTTGKKRTGYAKPGWVPEYNENGTILLLDDYVRK